MKVSRASIVSLAIALAGMLGVGNAFAQSASSKETARRYYQEGVALFNQGQYLPAIVKYKKADALAPAPLLDFNIGLAYDRSGDSTRALKHYRRYLKRDPRARNRDAVRAKINRIEGEFRAEANRKAKEAAAAAAATKVADEAAAAKAAEQAAAAKAAEQAAAAERPAPPVEPVPAEPPADHATRAPEHPPADTGAGAVAPSAPKADAPKDPFAATGDPELDTVGAIDINALRTRRNLSSRSSGARDRRGPAAAPPPRGRAAAPAPRPLDQPKKKSKAVYKQWWFWVVVGVSAVILIDIASTGDSTRTTNRLFTPMDRDRAAPQGGAVMLRF